jgi:hypothetical protein
LHACPQPLRKLPEGGLPRLGAKPPTSEVNLGGIHAAFQQACDSLRRRFKDQPDRGDARLCEIAG